MKKMSYFVSVNNMQQGPYTPDEIALKIQSGELAASDFIFDDQKKDWVLLMEHATIIEKLKQNKPKMAPPTELQSAKPEVVAKSEAAPKTQATPKTQAVQPANIKSNGKTENPVLTHWHVLKGETKFGPFSFPELIKMLQEKIVFEFDFVWTTGMDNWQRIAELSEFKPENIKKLKSSLMPEIKEIFFRRKHPRLNFDGLVIAHDRKQVWKGHAVELSAGGAGIIIENAILVPGQSLYLHFKAHGSVPAFNVQGEIVSKKYVDKLSGRDAAVCYGLKFSNLDKNIFEYLIEQTTKVGKLTAA